MENHTWAVVLAGGDGTRLATLTNDGLGRHVPKQFCSLHGSPSLLEQAVFRARCVVPEDHVCIIVARDHEHWWEPMIKALPEGNIIAQPRNRGTGNGVLLALLYILKRDPMAQVIYLPADHHVMEEEFLSDAMKMALAGLAPTSKEMHLLGIEPEKADSELGYIVPQETARSKIRGVRHFIEKPSQAVASELIRQGGLWNSLIFATNGNHLLDTFTERFQDNAKNMQNTLTRSSDPSSPPWALTRLYERIPEMDFSRHILQHHIANLRVVTVASCGWSDLGTPTRVNERVHLLSNHATRFHGRPNGMSFLDLADAVNKTARRETPSRSTAL